MIHDETIKFQGAVLVAIGGYTNIVMDSYGAIECEQGSLCPARRLAAGVPGRGPSSKRPTWTVFVQV